VGHELFEAWRPGRDGAWDRDAAAHLLRRGGFGATTSELERALEDGLDATLERLFAPVGHDPRLLDGVKPVLAAGSLEGLQAWWMALILGGGAPLVERAALLWHGHFATSNDKVADVRLMHRQNALLRERGLGDFRELLQAVARDPAMLVWLDGNQNRRGHPNENFAREVLELFALGIGRYGERDVQELARALTGWATEERAFVERAAHHDPGAKTIFGRSGAFAGGEALDLVLAQPACPRHVARRLLREFVSPSSAAALEEALSEILVEEGWRIDRTLARLLRSRLFFSAEARRSRIAGPVELVAVSLRALGAQIAPAEAARASARMGQSLFRPPSVKGWDGGRAWVNASSWIARHDFLARLAQAHLERGGAARVDLAAAFGAPSSIGEVPERVAARLLHRPPGESYLSSLRTAVMDSASLDEALAGAAALVMTSPEFHLV